MSGVRMSGVRMASHVHSQWSYDASWSLGRIASAFARRRYRAVLMCEHSQTFTDSKWREYREACALASTPDLLLVPGIEYADADDVLHVPVWGDLPFLGSRIRPQQLLEAVGAGNGAAVLAHPWRRDAWRRVDPAWLPLLAGVEVWNRRYDGWAPRSDSVALARSSGRPPFVALDFHGSRRQFFPVAMVAGLEPGTADEARICAALRAGTCRPEFLRADALTFASGARGRALSGLERARRRVARGLHALGM